MQFPGLIEAAKLMLALLVTGLAASAASADLQIILDQLDRSSRSYRNAEDWKQRRKQLQREFLRGAGLWPLPKRTSLNVIIHSRREYAGYSVENVALETLPGFFCTGNLYRPLTRSSPGPAILCPHGHFRPLGRFREEHQRRCAHLARMGAVVFSYSMVGWQDSQQTTHDDPLVLALQVWNSLRALDYLAELPEVIPSKIGITGASGGGTQAFFLAFLDERVAATIPVRIVYPWPPPPGCLCESGLPVMAAAGTNAIELAAAIAPRPQLLISIGNDNTRDFPRIGFPFIREVYAHHDASDRVRNLHLPHEYHDYGPSKRQAAYEFLSTHLGLASIPEDTAAITIESPAQMEVFNARRPLPSHALRGSAQIAEALASLPRLGDDGGL